VSACVEPDLLSQPSFSFGLVQCRDQFRQSGAVDASPGLDCRNAKRGGEMAFACARRPEEVNNLGATDEVELGQRCDPLAIK